ncbi:MAG: PTS sugar transporter subunit IIA [Phycisphaerae bacterium]|nr:PTS sugar transporter subunit IIA [Phycisphaerae bacterium]
MALEPYLRRTAAILEEGPLTRDDLIARIAACVAAHAPTLRLEAVRDATLAREGAGLTVTGDGVAFPHASLDAASEPLVVPCLVRHGVSFADTLPPARLILFSVGSRRDPGVHIRILARLARCALSADARERLLAATDGADLVERLLAEDRSHG